MDMQAMLAGKLAEIEKSNPQLAEMLRERFSRRRGRPAESQPSADHVQALAVAAEVRSLQSQLGDLTRWLVDHDVQLRSAVEQLQRSMTDVREQLALLLDVATQPTALPPAGGVTQKEQQ